MTARLDPWSPEACAVRLGVSRLLRESWHARHAADRRVSRAIVRRYVRAVRYARTLTGDAREDDARERVGL